MRKLLVLAALCLLLPAAGCGSPKPRDSVTSDGGSPQSFEPTPVPSELPMPETNGGPVTDPAPTEIDLWTTTEVAENGGGVASSLVRTDFSNDPAWRATVAAVSDPDAWRVDGVDGVYGSLTVVENRRFEGWTAARFVAYVQDRKLGIGHLFVADHTAQTSRDHQILVVDVDLPDPQFDDPDIGRSFRTRALEVGSISPNLVLRNMDFAEFADVADTEPDGVFRGFH